MKLTAEKGMKFRIVNLEEKAIKNQKSKIKNPNIYLPWLVLREIPFLGNIRYKSLIKHFGSPEAVLKASEAELKSCEKLSERVVKNILKHKTFLDKAKKELDYILKYNIRLLTLTDSNYPSLLKEIPDPPPVLSYYGTLNPETESVPDFESASESGSEQETQSDIESPCLAIVGSRKATTYGLNAAESLACKLASQGFQIVSGLARGIDSMAHKGALRAKGRTIAVLGSGLKQIYPRENQSLFRAIAETGCVFSEFKTFAAPAPQNFPIRNRIIAGLSCGTIVVEAAKKSGSLITARLTGEYNREVFAVPGSIKSRTSEGTHSLLKQGAKLVGSEKDILDELQQFVHISNKISKNNSAESADGSLGESLKNKRQVYAHSEDQHVILSFLEPYPIHIDTLIEKSGMESSKVSSALFDLELEGRIIRHPGNFYSIA